LIQLIVLLWKYAIDVPLWDSWWMAPIVAHSYDGTLSWHELWVPHNEHRPLFSRVILLCLARLTHWQPKYEIAANVVCGAGLFAAFVKLSRDALAQAEGNCSHTDALVPALSLLAFSLTQWHNWICGWQIQFLLNASAVYWGLVALTTTEVRWHSLIFAVAMGVVSSFTLASGMIYWPLGLVILVIRGDRRRIVRSVLGWAIASCVVVLVYVHGYEETRDVHIPTNPWLALEHPLRFLGFVLRMLGGPVVSYHRNAAVVAGSLGLTATCGVLYALYRDGVSLRPLVGLVALGAYGLGNCFLVAIGRAAFGGGNALVSRYLTLATPFWVMVVTLLILMIKRSSNGALSSRLRRGAGLMAFAGAVTATAFSSVRGSLELSVQYEAEFAPSRSAVLNSDWALIKQLYFADLDDMTLERIEAEMGPHFSVLSKYRLGPYYTGSVNER
jgi:hypothetical protein